MEPPLRRRVLVVEDDAISRLVLTRMITHLGHAAEAAADGAEALERLTRPGIDLVLMDCVMPVMDGYEATRWLRERETHGTERLRIVALTAHASSGDREQCRNAGMDGYLTKPLSLDQLRCVIER